MERTEFNFTTTYASDVFKRGTYKMDVTVYKQEFIFPIPQGSASTLFDITGTNFLKTVEINVIAILYHYL